MKYGDDLKKAIDFHGHLCPGLAYGYRVAKAAIEVLGKKSRDEDLVAIVENDSCAVDAIQAVTGCTFGKGNLIFHDYGKQVYTFLDRDTGRGVRFSVDFSYEETPEDKSVWLRFQAGERTEDVLSIVTQLKAKKAEAILNAPPETVMKSIPVTLNLPPEARLHPGIRCKICGEKVMEPRARIKNGDILCIPCSGY